MQGHLQGLAVFFCMLCTHVCVYFFVWVYACMCVCIVCLCMNMYVWMYVCVCMRVCACVCGMRSQIPHPMTTFAEELRRVHEEVRISIGDEAFGALKRWVSEMVRDRVGADAMREGDMVCLGMLFPPLVNRPVRGPCMLVYAMPSVHALPSSSQRYVYVF